MRYSSKISWLPADLSDGVGVAVRVSDDQIFTSMRSRALQPGPRQPLRLSEQLRPDDCTGAYLLVIGLNPFTVTPSPHTNVHLLVSKSADEFLEFMIRFGSVDPNRISLLIAVHTACQAPPCPFIGAVPGADEILHERRSSLACAGIADLLDGHVASCSDNHADIESVVPWSCERIGWRAIVAPHVVDGAKMEAQALIMN